MNMVSQMLNSNSWHWLMNFGSYLLKFCSGFFCQWPHRAGLSAVCFITVSVRKHSSEAACLIVNIPYMWLRILNTPQGVHWKKKRKEEKKHQRTTVSFILRLSTCWLRASLDWVEDEICFDWVMCSNKAQDRFQICLSLAGTVYSVLPQNILTHGLCSISTSMENLVKSWNLKAWKCTGN